MRWWEKVKRSASAAGVAAEVLFAIGIAVLSGGAQNPDLAVEQDVPASVTTTDVETHAELSETASESSPVVLYFFDPTALEDNAYRERLETEDELAQGIAQVYTDYHVECVGIEPGDSVEQEESEFRVFLLRLYSALGELISEIANMSPESLAPIMTELLVVGPFVSLASKAMRRILLATRRRLVDKPKPNPYIAAFSKDLERLILYFEAVPRSHLEEIAQGTGIDKGRIRSLLHSRALPIYHQTGCYWALQVVREA